MASVKKNERIQLDITDIAVGGEGIGKLDGFPFFVKNAVIGDTVEAVVTKVNKNYGFGKTLRILTQSPWRVEPACPKAEQCGGCQIMQLDYKKQLEFKENQVRNNLTRIGGIQFADDSQGKNGRHSEDSDQDKNGFPIFLPIIGMETPAVKQPQHFRNKMQFPVGKSRDGKVVTGFYAGRTHYLIEAESCPVAAEGTDELMDRIRRFLEENSISIYDESSGKGLVRHVLLRTGAKTGQIMVCLVINGTSLGKKNDSRFVSWMCDTPVYGAQIKSICLNVNRQKTNVILGEKIIPLFGEPYIEDQIGSLVFRISPLSFFQVNGIQTEKLYEKALEYANLSGSETVWDLYCGTGTISLFLAQKAGKVYGVEIVAEAIENAKENAVLNHIENAEFFCGKSEEIFPQMCANKVIAEKDSSDAGMPDVVVLDPPRKGCDSRLLEAILKVEPERIVYVSCDSATLARDVRILSEKYRLCEATPVDMFPHTCHVETVVCLDKKKPKDYIEIGVDAEDYYKIKDSEEAR